jgi:hypothetical protein
MLPSSENVLLHSGEYIPKTKRPDPDGSGRLQCRTPGVGDGPLSFVLSMADVDFRSSRLENSAVRIF